ncbi:MAG: glycoside hydrolase family 95 protein, partial [Prevotella sp.]|nr:glycoside hydrolase family 95 protein [Prevotella sp.]
SCISAVCAAQELRYDRPAEYFEEALPIGNGRLGAMVYGGTDSYRLTLNDITLWTGEPDVQPVNAEAYKQLPAVREALEREDYAAADTLVMRMQGHESEKYQPLGTLVIDFLSRENTSGFAGIISKVRDNESTRNRDAECIRSSTKVNESDISTPLNDCNTNTYIDNTSDENGISTTLNNVETNKLSLETGAGKPLVASSASKAPDVSGYCRKLSLATARATSTYTTADGRTFSTECFASSPDSVIVVRIASSGTFDARIRLLCALPHFISTDGRQLTNEGHAAFTANPFYLNGQHGEQSLYDGNRGIHFMTIISAENTGGEITAEGNALVADGCRELTLYIANSTSFNGAENDPATSGNDYIAEACRNIEHALTKGYDAIKASQLADYQALYNRVSLYLGDTDEAIKALPTDAQLRLYTQKKQRNPELEALYFQFGRYLLISSSRTRAVPANLQGLWNEKLSPAWRSNYTTNINLEENYWAAEEVNLSELHLPLLTFIDELQRTGRQSAASYYGVHKGWCAGHNSDIWAMTNPIGEGIANPQWANWPMGGAWLSTHIWEHYLFSRNIGDLTEFYPALRGAAEFCLGWLIEKNGELITSFSTSPENMFVTDQGYEGNTFYGGTADLAIIRECLTDAVKAARVLNTDSAFAARAEGALKKLRPYHIGQRGQLLEWYHDWKDADWQHRHQSHLIGVYPGHQITPASTPELSAAAAKSLKIKGNHTTGWSTGWRINLYARLRMADEAYGMVRTLLRYISPDDYHGKGKTYGGGTYPNLFDAHAPFQIDGNFGGCAGMAEMLIQSDESNIYLLPACPAEWASGSVKGLLTRCGATVDFSWENGRIILLAISSATQLCATITANGVAYEVNLPAGGTKKIL